MLPGISVVEGVLVVGLFAFLFVLVMAGLIGGLRGEGAKRRHRSSGFVDGGTNWLGDYGSHSSYDRHSGHSSDSGGYDGGSSGDSGGSDGGGCGGGSD